MARDRVPYDESLRIVWCIKDNLFESKDKLFESNFLKQLSVSKQVYN